jgi:hypothetical protein
MTGLHLVEPAPRQERGSAAVEDAFYWFRSQIDSPPTDDIFRTDYRSDGGGVVDVYIRTTLAFTRWARFLGFDMTQEPKGHALLNSASGHVTYADQTYTIRLHHTRFADGGELS